MIEIVLSTVVIIAAAVLLPAMIRENSRVATRVWAMATLIAAEIGLLTVHALKGDDYISNLVVSFIWLFFLVVEAIDK